MSKETEQQLGALRDELVKRAPAYHELRDSIEEVETRLLRLDQGEALHHAGFNLKQWDSDLGVEDARQIKKLRLRVQAERADLLDRMAAVEQLAGRRMALALASPSAGEAHGPDALLSALRRVWDLLAVGEQTGDVGVVTTWCRPCPPRTRSATC